MTKSEAAKIQKAAHNQSEPLVEILKVALGGLISRASLPILTFYGEGWDDQRCMYQVQGDYFTESVVVWNGNWRKEGGKGTRIASERCTI